MNQESAKVEFIKDQTFGSGDHAVRWVHLASDDTGSEQAIDSLDIPTAAKEGLMAEETRPKCVSLDGGLLLTLRAINFNHNAEHDDMVSVRMWVSDNQIVSTNKIGRSIRTVEDIEKVIKQHAEIINVGDFLNVIIDEITDAICDEVELYEDQIDELEEALSKQPKKIKRIKVLDIRRQTAQIKRFIMPQRDALNNLQYTYEGFDKLQSFRIKEQSERLSRYLDALDVIMERSLLIHDELRSIAADKQGDRMYVLSLVSAIFLPLSFLTGLFGMNVGGMPGANDPQAFYDLMIMMIALAVIIIVMMRLKKWV